MAERKVVLLFIDHGPIPDEVKQMAEDVGKAGVIVRFRNANYIEAEHKAEECHAVLAAKGVEIPTQYAEHPTAEEVINDALREKEALRNLTGDAPPIKNPEDETDPPPNAKPPQKPAGAKWGGNK